MKLYPLIKGLGGINLNYICMRFSINIKYSYDVVRGKGEKVSFDPYIIVVSIS